MNALLAPLLRSPALFAPLSAVAGLGLAVLAGRGVAAGLRRGLGLDRASAVGRGGLVGCTGRAVFAVTSEGGVANVRDPYGNIHRVVCRTLPGRAPLAADEGLVVVDYEAGKGVYLVDAFPCSGRAGCRRGRRRTASSPGC